MVTISLWHQLPAHTYFDCYIHCLAVMEILTSKSMTTSQRIGRILELLFSYNFSLHYVKRQDLSLSDFLSQIALNNSDLHESIPISFNVQEQLQEYYHQCREQLCIHTKVSARQARVVVPDVFGKDKSLIPEVKPEHQAKARQKLNIPKTMLKILFKNHPFILNPNWKHQL